MYRNYGDIGGTMRHFKIRNELGDIVYECLTYIEACEMFDLLEQYFTDYFEIVEIKE